MRRDGNDMACVTGNPFTRRSLPLLFSSADRCKSGSCRSCNILMKHTTVSPITEANFQFVPGFHRMIARP